MMFCPNCGKEVEDHANYCSNCGYDLSQVNEYDTEGYDVYKENDSSSLGFAFISFFFPLVGIILYIVWHSEYPKRARSCLKGFIVGIIVNILLMIGLFYLVGTRTSDSYNNSEDYDEEYYPDYDDGIDF